MVTAGLALTAILTTIGAVNMVSKSISKGKDYGYGKDAFKTNYSNTTYQTVLKNLQDKGYEHLTNPITQLESANKSGLISDDDYKLTKSYFERYAKRNGKEDWTLTDLARYNWDMSFGQGAKGTAEEARALRRVTEAMLQYEYPNAKNTKEWLDNVLGSAGNNLLPAKQMGYLDPNADLLPVPEAKWYTGQEMADLFGINYDPNYYYDLLKKGTEAQVAAQNFKNEQAIANSMADDAVSRNQYLQAIDNTKADAVIKGATLGQRMANELLANANAANTYATNQANAFNQAYTNIQPLIQKNALAQETANKYFYNNIFQPIGENIEKLYYDDIVNRGAYLNYNADQIAAALAANGQIAQSNAQAAANYNNAYGSALAPYNKYKFVYDRYREAADLRTDLSNMEKDNLAALNFDAYLNRNNPNAAVK